MIQTIIYPEPEMWQALSRRSSVNPNDLEETVAAIFEDVRRNGDAAISRYTNIFDGSDSLDFKVSQREIDFSNHLVSDDLKAAIEVAKNNIWTFHNAQTESRNVIETMPGVHCWRENRAIENIGIYIPGGSAPLFSTVLMLGIPAKIAGCSNITLCSPPDKSGNIHPAILYAANLLGIKTIIKVGGIQAIAALTFGSDSILKADKIFGPGNQFVTSAKQYATRFGVAIDMPAGPSEVLIVADKTGIPAFIAADLLSQAEHGPDSQVILACDDQRIIDETLNQLSHQLELLPRKEIAIQALSNSKMILFRSVDECLDFSNIYAPEHLIVASDKVIEYVSKVSNAGSVFLGNYSCESAGDYASGTNHTLPTAGFARNYSGVSVDSFVKKITFQQISPNGLQNIGPSIEIMAQAEELQAHSNAVSIRLKRMKDE